MVKTFRRTGKKVNFKSPLKNLVVGEEGKEIKKKFSEIKISEAKLEKIQKKYKKGFFEKGKQIKEKKIEIKKILNLWNDLNKFSLSELRRDEIINILSSQKKFIDDLLKHYLFELKNEEEYFKKIKKKLFNTNISFRKHLLRVFAYII